jgi:CheY-like chemotaxis protein
LKIDKASLGIPLPNEYMSESADITDYPKAHGLRIILVDDDEDVRFLTGRMLEKAGFNAVQQESGEACIAYLSNSTPPPLAILGQNMPKNK